MLAKDYMKPGETVREMVMRVLRDDVLTEENTDEIIAHLKIGGIFGGIVRRVLDSALPAKLLYAIDIVLGKIFGGKGAEPTLPTVR